MKLSHVLAGYRRNAGLGLRALALEIGINHSALNRFENGEEISSENLKTIFQWLLSEGEKRENRMSHGRPRGKKQDAEEGERNESRGVGTDASGISSSTRRL